MIERGFLPHQLVDCTLREFLFDMNILSRQGVKKGLAEWARNAKKEWLKRHKK
jgi:hypothetical protein